MNCCHKLYVTELPLQRNALRTEICSPEPRCELRPKTDQFGREINVARYVLSGGSAIDAAHPCVGECSRMCPRNVEGASGLMNNRKSGPCPKCHRINRREGFGPVACRDCSYLFNLISD